MLCAVCLDLRSRWDIVLQAWFCEKPNVGSEIVLQAKACTNRPLPRCTDGGLFCCLQYAMQVVTRIERRVNGDFYRQAEATIEAPRLSIVYVVDALHRDAEIVDGLLLIDGVTV